MKKMKILYLEDSSYDADIAKRVLFKAGLNFSLKLVDTESEYKEALAEYGPDIILSDHSLFQFNSLKALEMYKKTDLNVPFILVTGTVSEEFAVKILKEGADDYILKHNIAKLPSSIEQALENKKQLRQKEIAQQRILEQNTFLSQVLNSQPITFYKTKIYGMKEITYITENVERITGYTPNDFIKSPALRLDRIHPDDKFKVSEGSIRLQENNFSELTYRWKAADGNYKWLYDTCSVVIDETTGKKCIAGAWVDFTQKNIADNKNKHLKDSIIYAHNIQKTILPSISKIRNIFPESFVIHKPKEMISGDFYWFSKLNNNIILGVCDCVGNGVPGAMMCMLDYNILNEIIYGSGLTLPNDILKALNAEMKRKRIQNEQQDEEQIVNTMAIALCRIDEINKKIEFAGANRPLLVFKNNKPEIINGEKFDLGQAQPIEKEITKHTLHYETSDNITLYMFTDGITNQFGGNENKKLMKRKFIEKLTSIQSLSMKEQEIEINRFIAEWQGEEDQTDDILLFGIKI